MPSSSISSDISTSSIKMSTTSLLKPLPSYSTATSLTASSSSFSTSPNLVSSSGVSASLPSSTKTKNSLYSLPQGFTSSVNPLLTTSSSFASSSTPIQQPTQILVKDMHQATQRPVSIQRQVSCPSSIPTLTLPSNNNSKLLLVTTGKNNKGQDLMSSQINPPSAFLLKTKEQMPSNLQLSNIIPLPSYNEATGLLNSSR